MQTYYSIKAPEGHAAKALWFSAALLTAATGYAQDRKPVRWYVDTTPVNSREAVITLTADLEDGWYIYSQFIEAGGPLPTTFTFLPRKAYELVGPVKEESRPVRTYSEMFRMDLLKYPKVAVFTQKVKLHAVSSIVHGRIEFMVCTDKICLPPDVVEFSLHVKGEDAKVKIQDQIAEVKDNGKYSGPGSID